MTSLQRPEIYREPQDPDTGRKAAEDSSNSTEGSSDEDDLSETVRQGHHGHQHHGDGTDD